MPRAEVARIQIVALAALLSASAGGCTFELADVVERDAGTGGSGANAPLGPIALDATHVYFATDTSIFRVPKEPPGSEPQLLVNGRGQVFDLAVQDGYVYWTDIANGVVELAPVTGGNVELIEAGLTRPAGLAVDETHAYFHTETELLQKPNDGSGELLVLASQATPGEWDVALSTTHVYYTSQGTGAVISVPKGGGAITPLEPSAGGEPSVGIFVDGALTVYWREGSGAGGLLRAVDSMGKLFPLGLADVGRALVVDDAYVYWPVSQANGKILRIPKDCSEPCTRVELATEQGTPVAIAVDESYVYWTNAAPPEVRRVPK